MASPVVHTEASWQRLQAEGTCDRIHLWTLVGGGQVGYRLTTDLRHERAGELVPADYLALVTPMMLLHRRGRPQNLHAITPAAVEATRQAIAKSG